MLSGFLTHFKHLFSSESIANKLSILLDKYGVLNDADLDEICRLIEEELIDPNTTNRSGDTALHRAAYAGKANYVEKLLRLGSSVNSLNVQGLTALHAAATPGHVDCLNMLINAHANVNFPDNLPPLLIAAEQGHEDCVVALLKAGCKVNARNNNDGSTPLFLAAMNGHYNCVKELMNAGGNVNIAAKDGYTPLMIAAVDGHLNCIELISRAPEIDVNAQEVAGLSALHFAAQIGHIDCIHALLLANGNVKLPSKINAAPLSYAVANGHENCARALLEAGSDVNLQTINGQTPLMLAAYHGHVSCVKVLMEFRANVTLKDEEGKTAAQIAEDNDHIRCVTEITRQPYPSAENIQNRINDIPTLDKLLNENKEDTEKIYAALKNWIKRVAEKSSNGEPIECPVTYEILKKLDIVNLHIGKTEVVNYIVDACAPSVLPNLVKNNYKRRSYAGPGGSTLVAVVISKTLESLIDTYSKDPVLSASTSIKQRP